MQTTMIMSFNRRELASKVSLNRRELASKVDQRVLDSLDTWREWMTTVCLVRRC